MMADVGGMLNVNGNNAGRVFIVGRDYSQNLSLNVSIGGLTISGGSAVSGSATYGGGLLNFGTLSLNNCAFTGKIPVFADLLGSSFRSCPKLNS